MVKFAQLPKYEAYKDSGVEWIGEVPVHWNVYPLCFKTHLKSVSNTQNEELLSVYLDRGVIRFDEVGAKRTNVTSQDLSKYQLVEPGDFVLNNQQAWRGSVGVSEHRGIVSPAYLVLSLSNDINPKYANYFFRDSSMVSHYLVSSRGVGTIQRNLYWQQLKRAPIYLPYLEEQTLIANFLDQKTAQIDAAIAIKEQQIELLKERKQIIIQQAVTQGLDPNVPLKESGIIGVGLVPEHWDIVFNRRVFRENSRKVKGDELPLSLSQVDGVIPSNDMKERSLSPSHRNNFKLCFPGDLVVNRFKGHLGVFFNSEYEGIVTFHYGVFEPQKGVHTKFFEHLYHTEPYKAIYAGASNGMTVGLQNLSNQNFYMIKTIRPPEKEQVEICKYIEKISSEINIAIGGIELQIEKLKEYKTTLINSAVTGKIKITPEMVEQ